VPNDRRLDVRAEPAGAVPKAQPTARLFIAVWPPAGARAALGGWLRQWLWGPGAAVVTPARLHLTLHFLGQVPLARLGALQAALPVAAAASAPFELEFGRIERWPQGLVVLVAEAPPAPLLRLHAALADLLQGLGLAVEARPYRPHVTLARRAAGAVAPVTKPTLRWSVDHIALVRSERGYRELLRCPLGAARAVAARGTPCQPERSSGRAPG